MVSLIVLRIYLFDYILKFYGNFGLVFCSDTFGTMDGSWHDSDMQAQLGYNSSGNSNSSSISTSSSSDSDYRMTGETGDLEADADSLSCMKSGLTSADQMHIDGSKMVWVFI